MDSDEEKPQENGYGVFSINLPHQGAVTLNRTLDYEKSNKYYVTIVASVRFEIMPLNISFSFLFQACLELNFLLKN